MIVLGYVPRLRRLPLLYLLGLVIAALVQETVQAIFRGQVPTYTDFNAFKGDALGGTLAFVVWAIISMAGRLRETQAGKRG